MPTIFDAITQGQNVDAKQQNQASKNIFDVVQPEFKESRLKSIARWLYQVPSGIAQAVTYPADLLQLIGTGSALDPEEIEQIRRISEQEGIPFDEEKYLQSVEEASSMFPTQGNIERLVEEKTGAPLTAKTHGQKLLKLGASAGKFASGTVAQRGAAAATAPAVSAGLQSVGAPEPLAELAGLAASGVAAAKTPPIGIGTAKKPSGLTQRRFEKLKEPREVSPAKIGKIHEKLEGDFREISDKIIEESPVGITKAKLEENPAFKSEVAQQFREVESVAESLPERINTDTVKRTLVDNALKKKGTGFSPSEYDKDYRRFIQEFLKETPSQEIGAGDLVAQYRKNNKSLSEAYDPSKTYAFNRAKKDALLEYNRAIGDVIEEKFPNSEFSDLFKETNKQWAQIADAEAIDKFINAMFDGEVKFGKGKRFFENENYARPFKRALGDEGFNKFEQLMKDMLSTEKAASMLKKAKKMGFGDLAETAGVFILHPNLGKAKLGYQAGKKIYNGLIDSLLDKPELMITWEKGINELKSGDFKAAQKDFYSLRNQVEKKGTANVQTRKQNELPLQSKTKLSQ